MAEYLTRRGQSPHRLDPRAIAGTAALLALVSWLGQCSLFPASLSEAHAYYEHYVVDLSAWLRLREQWQDYAALASVLLAGSLLALAFGLAVEGVARRVWLVVAAAALLPLVAIPIITTGGAAGSIGVLAIFVAPFIAVPSLVWALRRRARFSLGKGAIVIALLSLMTWGFSTCAAGTNYEYGGRGCVDIGGPPGCGSFNPP